jgi:hypothetical protein
LVEKQYEYVITYSFINILVYVDKQGFFLTQNILIKIMKTLYVRIALLSLFLLAVFFVGTSLISNSVDNFKVIKIEGKISFVKTGKDLLVGDQFASDEKLNFTTENSRAAVISKLKGRFVLTADSKGGKATNLVPAMANVETRGGTLLNDLDVKNYFSNRFLLLNEHFVKITSKSFSLSASSYFYLQYEYNGEKVAKKLSHRGNDSLELSAEKIFTIDNKAVSIPLETKVTMYYKDGTKNKTYKVNTFQLIVPNNKELKAEITILVDELGNKTVTEKKAEILAFLYEFYGNPQKENVDLWLKEQFNF